jgi:hypothetical protein
MFSHIDDFSGAIASGFDPKYRFADRRFRNPDAEGSPFQ